MLADIDVTDVLEGTEGNITHLLSVLSILSDHMYRYYGDNADMREYMNTLALLTNILADNRKKINDAIENTIIVKAKFMPD